MSFEIKADGVDVEQIRRAILGEIDRKKGDLYTEEELRALAERGLEPVLQAGELRGELIEEFQARDGQWNFSFDTETVYRSSRGVVGQALEALRRVLRPVQKLFWNPNPMISALSRQADLNRYYVHLLHNLVLNGLTTAGDLTLYDSLTEGGTVIAVLHLDPTTSISVQPINFNYGLKFSTGLYFGFDATLVADLTAMVT